MNLELEKRKVLERDVEWSELASKGRDVEGILSFWTDDAIVMPPGQPSVVGKAALREYVRASLQIPGFSISWKSSDATLSPDGNVAYLCGENRVTMDGPDGARITMTGRAVTIWRKEGDGEWRCSIDIWNEPPVEP
ncbi:MAG TPA: DUF4440 domain-containing protein [Candidatus Eisenbacteria bacterium]|nr:DUF4440 domain-containing protein [Candidatus Eisenbacteria bacterium]